MTGGIDEQLADLNVSEIEDGISALKFEQCELGGENFKRVLRLMARSSLAAIQAMRDVESMLRDVRKEFSGAPAVTPSAPATWVQEFLLQLVKAGAFPASVAVVCVFLGWAMRGGYL